MQKLTFKAYAVKHKMSLFSVVKLVKTGKVKTTVEEENGKEVSYILLDDSVNEKSIKPMKSKGENRDFDVEAELKALILEVKRLKEEVNKLKVAY